MRLSGLTTHFAVLGHPIGHSLSPVMHNASIKKLGMDAVYLAFDVDPLNLISVLYSMRDMGFKGVNLTVPLKEIACNNIQILDDSAQKVKAVNTVEFLENGELKGHNTDGTGFIMAVKDSFQAEIKGLSVLVLGSGGAGRALALTCASQRAESIAITDIDLSRIQKLAREIKILFPEIAVKIVPPEKSAWRNASLASDLVIQATPVGMKEKDEPLLKADSFRKDQMLFDLVYMYPKTGIMEEADAAGARTANGLDMLMYQGARSFTIWTGKAPDIEAMRGALKSAVYNC